MDYLREYNLRELERGRQYRVLGRTGDSADPLNLFWTGSALELNLRATELWVSFDSSYMVFENWVDVMVNGALIQRFMVPKGRSEICIFRGMDRNMTRNVRIVRDTQAMHLDPRNSLSICSLITDGVFDDVPEPVLKLEFIGDSLTSGEGLTGAQDYLEWNPGCFSAVHTYEYLTCEMLTGKKAPLRSGILTAGDRTRWSFTWEQMTRWRSIRSGTALCRILRNRYTDFSVI